MSILQFLYSGVKSRFSPLLRWKMGFHSSRPSLVNTVVLVPLGTTRIQINTTLSAFEDKLNLAQEATLTWAPLLLKNCRYQSPQAVRCTLRNEKVSATKKRKTLTLTEWPGKLFFGENISVSATLPSVWSAGCDKSLKFQIFFGL